MNIYYEMQNECNQRYLEVKKYNRLHVDVFWMKKMVDAQARHGIPMRWGFGLHT